MIWYVLDANNLCVAKHNERENEKKLHLDQQSHVGDTYQNHYKEKEYCMDSCSMEENSRKQRGTEVTDTCTHREYWLEGAQ